MADALPDLPGLLQAGGILGLLAVLYMRLIVHHSQERGETRRRETALREEHAAELAAARARIAELQQQLEEQRRLRWRAEDAAATYRRRLGLPHLGVDGDHEGA